MSKPLSVCTGLVCLILSLCCLEACKGKDTSALLMEQARQAAQRQEYQQAKLLIDSVRTLYPGDARKLSQARSLMHEVELCEQKRNRSFCDSVIKARQAELPLRQKNFSYQPASASSPGYFIHKSQLFHAGNTQRCFLQLRVDDQGRYTLTSYYCNTWPIAHNRVRLQAADGSYCETAALPKDDAVNYSFRDEELYYEMLSFDKQALGDILEFACMHQGEDLKVQLLGKRKYSYTLSAKDISVMMDGMQLSAVLSDISRLLNESRLAQVKIQYLKKLIGEADSIK